MQRTDCLVGIHGEGGTFSTLFHLFLWDVVFLDGVPDVFYNPYQAYPLDLYTPHFYQSRQKQIESRLQEISESSTEVSGRRGVEFLGLD